MDTLQNFINTVENVVRTITISDLVDIVIISFLVYSVIKMIRDTHASALIKGILMLVVAYVLADLLGLSAFGFILTYVFQFGIFAVIVVFQPELRRALEQVGRTRIKGLRFLGLAKTTTTRAEVDRMIANVVKAVERLAMSKTGALIVIEKRTKIGDIISSGVTLDADTSAELLGNLFFPNTPLHDGAVVIRDARVSAAGCVLPLSTSDRISSELGTRHRAALGMSEKSDAVTIAVSEETGIISVAISGALMRGFTPESLTKLLTEEMENTEVAPITLPQDMEETK